MRTDYIHRDEMGHLLAALMPANRLALEVSMSTGLRIGDVLDMRTDAVRSSADGRLTVRESKTGKNRRIRLRQDMRQRMLSQAGRVYIWEGRNDWRKPRTRQAVYKDLSRIVEMYRLPKGIVVAPHTARKIYAVEQLQRTGDIKRVQELLQHESEAVTVLYAMSDVLTARRLGIRK